jgi:hypothetical protein
MEGRSGDCCCTKGMERIDGLVLNALTDVSTSGLTAAFNAECRVQSDFAGTMIVIPGLDVLWLGFVAKPL